MFEDIIGNVKKEIIKPEELETNKEEGYTKYKLGNQVIKVYKTWLEGFKKN